MKNFIIFFLLLGCQAFAQTFWDRSSIEASFNKGSILEHMPDMNHLIKGQPYGWIVNFNYQTTASNSWASRFNYPEFGATFVHHEFQNDVLGTNFSLGVHYSMFFWKRQFMFRLGQGLAITTNPYHKYLNNTNIAFGSQLLSSNTFQLQYRKLDLWNRIGVQLGVSFQHYSNGKFKAPNRGLNTYSFTAGLNYRLGEGKLNFDMPDSLPVIRERIHFNLAYKTGWNEHVVPGIGKRQFHHISAFVDKRWHAISAFQAGVEYFDAPSLKDYIDYYAIAFAEEDPIDPKVDYRKVGLFVGHELFLNRISIETQIGGYVYKPFRTGMDVYQRVGLKYYWTPKVYNSATLLTHGAKADAFEVGIGVRL